MERLFHFTLLAFTSLFTMVTPFGVIPLFTALTENMPPAEVHRIARRGVTTAFIILILIALAGNFIFEFFHISINSLKIVGGILFFMSGYDMLQAKLSRLREEGQSFSEFLHDFAISPLGIPIICGPGSITMTVVLYNDTRNLTEKLILFATIVIVLAITYILLIGSRKILSFLGDNGNKVLMRVMGLIVMVIAVELMFAGLKPIVQDMITVK